MCTEPLQCAFEELLEVGQQPALAVIYTTFLPHWKALDGLLCYPSVQEDALRRRCYPRCTQEDVANTIRMAQSAPARRRP